MLVGFVLLQGQTIQQPSQFMSLNTDNVCHRFRPSEPIFFQPLMPEAKAVTIPVQDFYDIPFSITKGKQVA
jgi:hypothetical protein